jgi:flagellar hook-associated protein 2
MSSNGFSLGSALSGGIDVQTTVTQLMQIQRQPENQLKSQQTKLNSQASAIRTISGALSDLQTKVQVLTNFTGQLTAQTTTSSNSNLISATSDGTATLANHQIVVKSLAQTSSIYTNTLAASTTTFAQGSFDISIGGTKTATITVDGTNNTFAGVAAAINAANAGVTASVVTDTKGARLSILSTTSGTAGQVAIANNTSGLTFTPALQGKDASLNVDGIDIVSGSNQITGVLSGLTLNLSGADPNTTVSLGVKADAAQSSAAIQSFVTSYNTAINLVNAQFVYDPVTKFSQPLAGDPSLTILQQQLYTSVSYTTPGQNNGIDSLAKLGITANNDGTLSVDSSKLSAALAAQPSDVQNFFRTASTGFAQKLNATLTSITDPTTGGLQVELSGLNTTLSGLANQINDFENRMTAVQQDLLTQYSHINATLQQIPLLLSQINGQLGSIG